MRSIAHLRWQGSALAERLVLVEQAYTAQGCYISQLASHLFTWMLIADRLLQAAHFKPATRRKHDEPSPIKTTSAWMCELDSISGH